MSEYKLYIIELENNKFFLHVSLPIYEYYLFKVCSILFDFVKKNPPISILNNFDIIDILDINYYVKYFMRKYGIDNVRGGNYTNEILDIDEKNILIKEIFTTFENYDNNNNIIEEIIQKYQYKEFDKFEKENIEKSLRTYNNKKYLLSILTNNNDNHLYIINDLIWIKEEINNIKTIWDNKSSLQELYKRKKLSISTDIINRYKFTLKRIHSIISIYFSLDKNILEPYLITPYLNLKFSSIKKYTEPESILITKPQFILDMFFYHPHSIINWDKHYELLTQLLENITDISYTILNIIDELNFDLSYYSDNFEKKMKYSLEIIPDEYSFYI